jgi:hypothetical protein
MDKKEAAKEWFDIANKDLALAGHAWGIYSLIRRLQPLPCNTLKI